MDENEPLPGYKHWDSHPKAPVDDWKLEVEMDNTRLGYWNWVRRSLEDQKD